MAASSFQPPTHAVEQSVFTDDDDDADEDLVFFLNILILP
jgi:hypothetical protein